MTDKRLRDMWTAARPQARRTYIEVSVANTRELAAQVTELVEHIWSLQPEPIAAPVRPLLLRRRKGQA